LSPLLPRHQLPCRRRDLVVAVADVSALPRALITYCRSSSPCRRPCFVHMPCTVSLACCFRINRHCHRRSWFIVASLPSSCISLVYAVKYSSLPVVNRSTFLVTLLFILVSICFSFKVSLRCCAESVHAVVTSHVRCCCDRACLQLSTKLVAHVMSREFYSFDALLFCCWQNWGSVAQRQFRWRQNCRCFAHQSYCSLVSLFPFSLHIHCCCFSQRQLVTCTTLC
jgi:hypothetical protein